jgi:UDPglucose 6-dehydrogenase
MTITIIGHGYVGIVAACVFADFGNTVHVIGHTPAKLEKLKSGDPLIYEPGLAELLQKILVLDALSLRPNIPKHSKTPLSSLSVWALLRPLALVKQI